MRLFGRKISTYIRRIPQLPLFLRYFVRCVVLFANPVQFVAAYIGAIQLPGKLVLLRNGLQIHLSSDSSDIITVCGIFIKKEYGDIRRQSIIVDVGANIGVYALYAAQQQAGQVFAYEPNSEAYECLVQSVRDNHLEGLVVPQRTAVLGAAKGAVRFPVKSNVHNAIIQDASNTDFEWVNTSSISDIVMRLGRVDLLKLDCEGAEYDILFSAEAAVYDRINSVRMEYHLGRVEEIDSLLQQYGFVKRYQRRYTSTCGMLWYERPGER